MSCIRHRNRWDMIRIPFNPAQILKINFKITKKTFHTPCFTAVKRLFSYVYFECLILARILLWIP